MKPTPEKRNDSVLVLDTCAILSGFSGHLTGVKRFTTPNVLSELPRDMIDPATGLPLLNEASIEVLSPSDTYLLRVDFIVKSSGDESLSVTDKSLLALALELKDKGRRPLLVSDDYALQNMAELAGVSYLPYVERGIRSRYTWRLVCPACFKEYQPSSGLDICSICGTRLKKKASRATRVKRE